MRNLIEESKVKSTRTFKGDVPWRDSRMFDMVTVKFEKEGRVYVYELHRSEDESGNHYIYSTSFTRDDDGWPSGNRSKLYTDSAKFDAAIKRIQSKMS